MKQYLCFIYLKFLLQMKEFRIKMGSILPTIKKNNPPQSRTEFEGLTDLLNYISTDYSQNKLPTKEEDS